MSFEDFRDKGDHPQGYEALYLAALPMLKAAPPELQVVEVGTREGGSALTLLNAIRDTNKDRFMHTIDPYGAKPFLSRHDSIKAMYPDAHYRKMLENITPYVITNELNWTHWKLTSEDWMYMYPKLEFWADTGLLKPAFCFVHLDGDHTTDIVATELNWFAKRTTGLIVIDDADQLDLTDTRIARHKGKVEDNHIWVRL